MEKIYIANLPTRIEKIENIDLKADVNLYVKRDDFTGIEYSGNKIRKLEYLFKDAIRKDCNTIITTGAVQSNHCRATAAIAVKYGLKCELVIKGEEPDEKEGNIFLDYILGANVNFIDKNESAQDKMREIKNKNELNGDKAYIIPMGASNSLGSFGYVDCYYEILEQERKLGLKFDIIAVTVGSGGTYAGLWYGNHKSKSNKKILGFSVNESKGYFNREIIRILKDMEDFDLGEKFNDIYIIDDYIGDGYGICNREQIKTIIEIARTEGIVFDPCYTGKAIIGLINEIERGNLDSKNILFINTGGFFGWTEENRKMAIDIINSDY
ncbi:MAG: D-cysteine desulfhydrase family protein [Tissierellia bacterium]|nr:D-cysteine desulfhydrase family protein [Tissierellia bacterium]